MPLAWLTEDTVLYGVAALSFLLFIGTSPVTAALTSRRRSAGMRALKVFLLVVIFVVVLFPVTVMLAMPSVDGRPCALFLVFFSLFTYYAGKRLGRRRGRNDVMEQYDLNAYDNGEEVADRLLESRLRFPAHQDVVASWQALQAGQAGAPEEVEVMAESSDELGPDDTQEVFEVQVEAVREKRNSK